MRLPRPALLAHRGASAERPEITLAAFSRALDLGADGIETDAHLTRDGEVILAHDETAARTAGVSAAWRALSLGDVRRLDAGARFVERDGTPWRARGCLVPTLDEALRALPGVFFNVDVKAHHAAMASAVVRVVRAAGAEERVLLTSFDEATLTRVRAEGYGGPVGLGARGALLALFAPMPVARRLVRGGALQIPDRVRGIDLGTRRVRARCDALGLRLDYWVVNDPARAEALLAAGADGLVSDDVSALREAVRRSRAARAPSS